MTDQREPLEGGIFDVRDILGDKKKMWEFCLALWCATTGLPVEEALRREAEAAERKARYGPPIDESNVPWPDEAECEVCGKTCKPFGTSSVYMTDVPSHRWVRVWRCMPCDDEHQRRKWAAIGRGIRQSKGKESEA